MSPLYNPIYKITDLQVSAPTTFAEALAYTKAVAPTIVLPTGIGSGIADLAAGGGAAAVRAVSSNQYNTTATGGAVCGDRYNTEFACPAGVARSQFSWDRFFAIGVGYERQQSVANSVAYIKASADTGHGALGSKGIGVSFANLVATLDVYDTGLHPTAAGWSIIGAVKTAILLVHVPGLGAALYTNDVQRVTDTTNILSGTASSYVVLSLANGVTATDQYFWNQSIKMWSSRI